MSYIELKSVGKSFGEFNAFDDFNLSINEGEFLVLVGPSGCGKSTLLRMIAGLEELTSGSIHVAGEDVSYVRPSKRGLAMVFQTYALYPHMSVYNNIAFGLKMARKDKAEINHRVTDAAHTLGLTTYLARRPAALSGGQRQRVAIGRAIVREPRAFLFDEPLSNLDAELRGQMRIELAELHHKLGRTMIFVTHDQVEAMTLADRIVVLRSGKIEQVGTPEELYNSPANTFVAGFIGSPKTNFFPAAELGMKDCVTAGVRPEHLDVTPATEGVVTGEITVRESIGSDVFLHLHRKNGQILTVRTTGADTHRVGDRIGLSPQLGRIMKFDADGVSINN